MQRLQTSLNDFLNNNRYYMTFSIIVVIASLIPLTIKESPMWVIWVEWITTGIFIVEYVSRWICCPLSIGKGWRSYLIYPFRPLAIVDLLTILPTFILLNQGFKALRIIRLVLIARFYRFVRNSRSVTVITEVLEKERQTLGVVCVIAVAYIIGTALIVFNVEPDTFDSFFDAVYWACVSLTTVGYGDIYPVSVIGRAMSMVSALVGIAIVALPAGIITGGYIEAIKNHPKQDGGAKATK